MTQLQKQIEEIRQNRAAKREELVKRTEQMQAAVSESEYTEIKTAGDPDAECQNAFG